MDVFVLPSLQEGLGLALMEAMAFGLTVVGSAVGGIQTLIKHGHNGMLVPVADSNALSIQLRELLSNSRKREALGKEARAFISRDFSQEEMVSKTEKVY